MPPQAGEREEIMSAIVVKEAKHYLKCVSCREGIRTCEKFLQVTSNGKAVRGERYCLSCKRIAIANNDIGDDSDDSNDSDDGERFLRQMENYAAYQYNGCTNEYWTDRDAGYCE